MLCQEIKAVQTIGSRKQQNDISLCQTLILKIFNSIAFFLNLIGSSQMLKLCIFTSSKKN